MLLVCGATSIASAGDNWVQVHTKNFLLIGNASEKDIRKVAENLERFRSGLSKVLNNSLTSPVGTNVVVFKDEASYMPYKPLRRDGNVDSSVQGYFRSGDDINYITVTIGHGEEETFRTIFHEYVHFAVSTLYPNAEVPAWFNEGMAEYYSTFSILNDQRGDVGGPIRAHAKLLRESTLLPLETLFTLHLADISNSSESSRPLFYAESWAFVHFLLETGRAAALNDFVTRILAGAPLEHAFKDSFRQDYRAMGTAFQAYVDRGAYAVTRTDIIAPAYSGLDLRATTLSPSYTSAYLGDLLYHLDRPAEAEIPLLDALKKDPNNEIANADLGLIRSRQGKPDEAEYYLELAARNEQTSAPILYKYALVLSRGAFEPAGSTKDLEPTAVVKMRAALHRAIAIAPSLAESYDLLAATDLVEDADLAEAANSMETALRLEPTRNDYALRLAEIYLRQKRYDSATRMAERVLQTGVPDLRSRADAILTYICERDMAAKKAAAAGTVEPIPLGPRTDPPMTRAEVDEANALSTLRSINADLRIPEPGETRAIGSIERIDCSKDRVHFAVRSSGRDLSLSSHDFQQLTLRTFDKDAAGAQIGCEADLKARTAVVTFRASGELVAIEFVPADFKLLSPDETTQPRARLVRQDQVDSDGYSLKDDAAPPKDLRVEPRADDPRRAILASLGTPADGEKREVGYLQGVECDTSLNLLIRTSTGILRLAAAASSQTVHPVSLVPEVAATELTCSSKLTDLTLIVTYKPSAPGSGVISSLAIVPRGFKLD